MRAIVFVVVASLFVHTVKALESKQLNLALETILSFDKKDRSEDLAVINKVQDFLEQIKNAMQGNARRSNRVDKDITFTDFILQAAKILKRLEDTDLEEVYVIIHDASRRYINKETDLRELFDNSDMRRFISGQLDSVKEMAADDLRRYLDTAINLIEYIQETGKTNDILEIGNTLYDGASFKLRRALENLRNIKKDDSYNLENILRTTLDSLVFNHYIDLSKVVRSKIVKMVQHYWQEITKGNSDYNAKVKIKNPVRSTPFRHERKIKHSLKKKYNSDTEKSHLGKSRKDDTKDISAKPEIFLSGSELKKLIHNDNEGNEQKNKRYPAARNKLKASNRHKGKINKFNNGKDKKITKSSDSNESEEKYVMGGQVSRGLGFRGQSSNEDIVTSTEEIVIQHSNVIDVGLSRKIPGRLNITFVSAEIDKDFTLRSSANDKFSDETRIVRKSIVNDALEDAIPEKSDDVKKMIKNLEEQLEGVKDQIAYIKSFTQIESKRSDSDVLRNIPDNVTGAEGITPMSFSFRAQYDTDSLKPGSQNDTRINTDNTFKNITNIDTKMANETNKVQAEKNADKKQVKFENSKTNNETQSDNRSYQKDVLNKVTSQGNVTKEDFNSTAVNLVEGNP